jgi:MASE1
LFVNQAVLAFVVFPFVIWAAIRFRVPGAAVASLLVASVAVWGTTQGFGPFVNHTPLRNAVLLQVFVAVTSLTGLMLAAVINEREHVGEALKIAERLQAAKEMEIARQVQQKLFPQRLVELKTLEYAGACNQARSVGGDYYDFVELGPSSQNNWQKAQAPIGRCRRTICS